MAGRVQEKPAAVRAGSAIAQWCGGVVDEIDAAELVCAGRDGVIVGAAADGVKRLVRAAVLRRWAAPRFPDS
jgi:hypothetical protein